MTRYSIREIVEMAVQTEKLGYQFYTEMARKFGENPGLSELFTTLASKEAVHEQTFAKMLGGVKDAEPAGWDEAQPYFRAIVESEYFLGRGKALPSMDKVTTVKGAVDFALGFEKETALYFTGLRGAVPAGDRVIVDNVIAEETAHIAWLARFRERL
jgi:rubrerythrin